MEPSMERSANGKVQDSEPSTPYSTLKTSTRDRSNMEDSDGTLSSVAQCIEKLRQNSSTAHEKENSLKQLLELIETREKAFGAVGSHSQAVPILVSLLRGIEDESTAWWLYTATSCSPKVQLRRRSNGCSKTIFAVSQGGSSDNVGSKIFSTEGVVPALWEQLKNGQNNGSMIDALLTGALKNLSKGSEAFWSATKEAGGVDVLIKLLEHGQISSLDNVCYLLGFVIMEEASVCSKIIASGSTKQLLQLLGPGNEASIRADAAGALKALSAQCKDARREIANSNGIPALINATIAPSKEFMQGESAQALQESAMSALANISGGLSYVISSLGESLESCISPAQIADTLGALASALIIYDSNAESVKASDPLAIEKILVKQFKPKVQFLVKERTIEALASLYGNSIMSKVLNNADAKHLLVGLITMATGEAQDELIKSLLMLCNKESSLWLALQGRQGIQLLISLLGLSSEQQQECAVSLLCLLSEENNESKWAITAAGGIPPLVQILEIGSQKAKEDSAMILGNLCNHSEDIRACVQSADAVPALLCQLSALLTSEQPESKVYVLDALKSLLTVVPLNDILHEGSAANDAIHTMIKILNAVKEETQSKSAASLAELFHCRKDLRESHISVNALLSVMKLLDGDSEKILLESCHCLAAIFLSIKQNKEVASIAKGTFNSLVLLSSSPILEVSEQATCALANILMDSEISTQANPEIIIFPVTRVLRDGTIYGKTHAAAAVGRLFESHTLDQVSLDSINRAGTVLALAALLEYSSIESDACSEALHALALLSGVNDELCCDQSGILGSIVFKTYGCVPSIARRVIGSNQCKVKVGGAALLICAAKENSQKVLESLNESSLCTNLIHSLVSMLRMTSSFSDNCKKDICIYSKSKATIMELGTIEFLTEKISQYYLASQIGLVHPYLALRLLTQLAVDCPPNKIFMVEAGVLEGLTKYLSLGPQDATEEAATELLGILFSSAEIRGHESAFGAVNQLVAVLRLGARNSRYSAAKALENLFSSDHIRNSELARQAVQPLVEILNTGLELRALEKLLDDEQLAELIAAHGAIIPLVSLLFGKNYLLHESVARALVKLGRDRPSCKMEMVKSGIIESILNILNEAPDFLNTAFAELLRILTNNADIAKGPSAAKVVEPLLSLLVKHEIGPDGQHSVLQVLVNILEQPDCRGDYNLDPHLAVEPVIALLDSPTQAVQQLAAELLSHLLLEENLQKDPITEQAVAPLIHILGSGVHVLQQKAIKALVSISLAWPNAIAKEGGVYELSKAILQADPPLPQYSSEFFLEVPVAVLVQLLRSGTESTVVGALNALLVLESDDSTSAEAMVESGAIEALLELLKNHQCEDTTARLLETLLNNVKIRETKAAKSAISPLSMYLLDPLTQSQQGRLLAALALGDLFQNEGLARTTDAASACRALVNLLEEQPTEEMKVVAICALQNLISGECQAAIEKDLWTNGSVNEEYLKALNALLSNFPRLRAAEPATLSIPHLVTSLKTGSEATQEAALDSLFLLRQAWSACPIEVFKAQSVAASEAIPLLQYLIQSGPPRFQEKAELLLQCLPGTLTITIKRGNNLKQSVGNPSVFCKLTLGNSAPRQTKSSFGKVTIQIDRVVMLGSVAGEYTLLPVSKSGPPRNLEIEFQCLHANQLQNNVPWKEFDGFTGTTYYSLGLSNQSFLMLVVFRLHYTWVDVGTPNISFLVALDAGSDLFWVPCDCIRVPLYQATVVGWCSLMFGASIMQDKELAMYNPDESKTSKHIFCSHEFCSFGGSCRTPNQPCPYIVNYYSENTSTSGWLLEDMLYLIKTEDHVSLQATVIVGCGRKQSGGYLDGIAPDGVLGLGFGEISVPSMLARVGLVRNSFSICFRSDGSGRLFFGDQGGSTQHTTPFIASDGKYITYIVEVESFCVGAQCAERTNFLALVDSGSSFTFLPEKVYKRVSLEFDRQMNASRLDYEDSPWEYCYSVNSLEVPRIPAIILVFSGNDSFEVSNPVFPLYGKEGNKLAGFCLAVQSSAESIGTIGQNFMTEYHMVFDRENFKLGWSRSDCHYLDNSIRVPLTPSAHSKPENPLPTNQQQRSPNARAVPPAIAGRAPIIPSTTSPKRNARFCSLFVWFFIQFALINI
ncbi:hypothetical protein HPP92_013081 [Vanilla planifolia]|uniref:Peptidase A1 domain-containing protein n=1 Tax=Vanilla planifolia TaxID=51239 RepID=A0A835QMR2_VANPL|nr:hypothetical protein HPP92_013081 [Vanilla planifolia]